MDDADRIARLLGRRPVAWRHQAGGDIARTLRLHFADGTRAIAKFARPGQPALTLEARMLADLRHATLPVPHVLAVDDDLLLLEWIDPGRRSWDDEVQRAAGQAIARLHDQSVSTRFGHGYDTVIGSLPQVNPWTASWREFYGQYRLLACADSAHAAGRLPTTLRHRLDALVGRLTQWLDPGIAPSLVHGDLWGGNMLPRADGSACFIDPAIHYADAEVDLAMATLFGSVGDAFFDGYREVRPVAPEFFAQRRTLYQLYPLLVHVTLFGGSYVADVDRALTTLGV